MNNNERRKSRGDKVITWLRKAGDVAELTTISLLTGSAIGVVVTVGIRLCTDGRISYNKRKMKRGGM